MSLRVVVDKDKCISSGKCVADAPAVFAFDDDELAHPVPGAALPGKDRLSAIAGNCPGEAIEVFDGDTQIAP